MTGPPALQIAALSSSSLDMLKGPPDFPEVTYTATAGTCFEFSKDGNKYVKCGASKVSVCDAETGESLSSMVAENVTLLSLSPTGKYLVTHSRVPKEGHAMNLKVWETSNGSTVAEFHRKGITQDVWPVLQFDAQETHMFMLVKGGVAVYELDEDLADESHKVTMDGITQFSVCPGTKGKVFAAFSPEAKGGMPAVLACCEWAEGGTVTNRKQFFRAQRSKLLWNSAGTHVLGHTSCDFDSTNQSYFGESRLYLLTADGRIDMHVTMENETMVADAEWSPDGKYFVALGGVSPALAVLFDTKGKAVYKLGSGPYNTVRWNPQSRFVMLAGFGNMPGDIRLFEKKADNACKPMGGCRSECSVLVEWSPCGRYFLTASIAPRMRVDNRVTIFTYYGTEIKKVAYDELRAACWRPRAVEAYPDRGQSPERLQAIAEGKKQGVNLTAAPKVAGYVPPHLRGSNGQRQQRQVEGFDADEAAGRIRNMMANRVRNVEGAESIAPNKNSNKNARKRANKAKKQAETKSSEAEEVAQGVEQMTVDAEAVQPADAAGASAAAADAPGQDPAKRLRNLRKKLTKIEAAKEKQASGTVLTPEQLESVNGEAALRAEMRSLGATDV